MNCKNVLHIFLGCSQNKNDQLYHDSWWRETFQPLLLFGLSLIPQIANWLPSPSYSADKYGNGNTTLAFVFKSYVILEQTFLEERKRKERRFTSNYWKSYSKACIKIFCALQSELLNLTWMGAGTYLPVISCAGACIPKAANAVMI